MAKLIVTNASGHTIPKEQSDPVVNVKPMLPTGFKHPDEEDVDEHDKKLIALQEAADKRGILLPTQLNRRIVGKKTDPNSKGIRPMLPNTKY